MDRKRSVLEQPTGSKRKSSTKKMKLGTAGDGDGTGSTLGNKNDKIDVSANLQEYSQDIIYTDQGTFIICDDDDDDDMYGPVESETEMFELEVDDFQAFTMESDGKTEDIKVIECAATDNGRTRRVKFVLDLDEDNSLRSNSELLDAAADPQLQIHISSPIIGCPISDDENLMVELLLEDIGQPGDINCNNEIVVYLPRGKSFSPFLELYQIQLATYIRMRKISHKFEVISNETEVVPAIRFNGHDIYDPKLCCELIKRAFPTNQLSQQHTKRERLNFTFGKNIYLGILLWQWCSGEENEMKKLSPGYSSSTVVLTQIKVQELVNREAKELWENRDVIDCINDNIAIASSELGNNDFFFGCQPDDIDCAAFVLFSQLAWNKQGSPFRTELLKHKNLSAFMMKMKTLFWPEWLSGYPLPLIWGATQFGLSNSEELWSSQNVHFSSSASALLISSLSSQDEVLKKMKGLRI